MTFTLRVAGGVLRKPLRGMVWIGLACLLAAALLLSACDDGAGSDVHT